MTPGDTCTLTRPHAVYVHGHPVRFAAGERATVLADDGPLVRVRDQQHGAIYDLPRDVLATAGEGVVTA